MSNLVVINIIKNQKLIKKINNMQRPIGRSTTFEVFKIKNPKRNFNLTNLNINYQINNIKLGFFCAKCF